MTDITKAVPFVAARQKALTDYEMDRRRANAGWIPGGPRAQGYSDGFAAGALFGIQTERAVRGEAELAAKSQTAPNIGKRAGKVADLILVDLRTNGPATAERIADRIGVRLNSVSPRFAKLIQLGLVRIVSGELGSRANKAVYASIHLVPGNA